MVIIGGLGSIMGSFVGAAFILILPIMLNLIPSELGVPLSTETITHLEFIIFGSLICYLLIKEPHGVARLISIGKEKLRLLPFPYSSSGQCEGSRRSERASAGRWRKVQSSPQYINNTLYRTTWLS